MMPSFSSTPFSHQVFFAKPWRASRTFYITGRVWNLYKEGKYQWQMGLWWARSASFSLTKIKYTRTCSGVLVTVILPLSWFSSHRQNCPSLETDCLQLSVDSEMIVPFGCYKCGQGHTILSGILGSSAQSLASHQCPHSCVVPMCQWSHRFTIVMLCYGFPGSGVGPA